MLSIFISYSRENSDQLESISQDCEALGHTVWIDKDLKGGQKWWDQVLLHIRESDIVLFILSDASVASSACKKEFFYADALGKTIIPIQVSAKISINLLPEEIAGLQIVDYSNPDKSAGFELAKALTNAKINPLPENLPSPPELPISYMGKIAKQLEAETLSIQQQSHLFLEIKQFTQRSENKFDAEMLLNRLLKRPDLYASIASEIKELTDVDIHKNAQKKAEDTSSYEEIINPDKLKPKSDVANRNNDKKRKPIDFVLTCLLLVRKQNKAVKRQSKPINRLLLYQYLQKHAIKKGLG